MGRFIQFFMALLVSGLSGIAFAGGNNVGILNNLRADLYVGVNGLPWAPMTPGWNTIPYNTLALLCTGAKDGNCTVTFAEAATPVAKPIGHLVIQYPASVASNKPIVRFIVFQDVRQYKVRLNSVGSVWTYIVIAPPSVLSASDAVAQAAVS